MFHCIQQAPGSGGLSQFCDGFNIARALKEQNPAAFDILSRYPVQYVSKVKEYVDHEMVTWRLPIR